MKLRFAKGLKLTAVQKAKLQGFEDKLDRLAKREAELVKAGNRVDDQYGDYLTTLGLTMTFVGDKMTVIKDELAEVG